MNYSGSVPHLLFYQHFSTLVTCATDKTVRIWDMETGTCKRKFKTHLEIVNSCHPARRGPQLVASASDDGFVMVFLILSFHHCCCYHNLIRFTMCACAARWRSLKTGLHRRRSRLTIQPKRFLPAILKMILWFVLGTKLLNFVLDYCNDSNLVLRFAKGRHFVHSGTSHGYCNVGGSIARRFALAEQFDGPDVWVFAFSSYATYCEFS